MAATRETTTPTTVLASVRARRTVRDAAEVGLLREVLEWAVVHEVTDDPDDDPAATYIEAWGDTGLHLAGEGAPKVSEFATYELAAALKITSEAGKTYLGKALELRHRLPRLFARVVAGDLPVWRAGRIAEHTITLPADGAAQVDRHLAPVAHKCSWTQVERLVEEALVRYDPQQAVQRRVDAAERRHFDVHTDQVSFFGTVYLDGELDLADALDLDLAIRRGAAQLAELGNTEPLDVRRSIAAGDLARHQPTLDYDDDRPRRPSRQLVLHVHLSDQAVARCGNTRSLLSVEQVKTWSTHPGTIVVIKPVIDLNQHAHVEAYEIPDRIREHVALRDVHCAFPYCTRPAARCDCDHVIAHDRDGPTCACNLAPLCRTHHRAKTHSAWTYTALDPGTYLWASPHGLTFLRDHQGTSQP